MTTSALPAALPPAATGVTIEPTPAAAAPVSVATVFATILGTALDPPLASPPAGAPGAPAMPLARGAAVADATVAAALPAAPIAVAGAAPGGRGARIASSDELVIFAPGITLGGDDPAAAVGTPVADGNVPGAVAARATPDADAPRAVSARTAVDAEAPDAWPRDGEVLARRRPALARPASATSRPNEPRDIDAATVASVTAGAAMPLLAVAVHADGVRANDAVHAGDDAGRVTDTAAGRIEPPGDLDVASGADAVTRATMTPATALPVTAVAADPMREAPPVDATSPRRHAAPSAPASAVPQSARAESRTSAVVEAPAPDAGARSGDREQPVAPAGDAPLIALDRAAGGWPLAAVPATPPVPPASDARNVPPPVATPTAPSPETAPADAPSPGLPAASIPAASIDKDPGRNDVGPGAARLAADRSGRGRAVADVTPLAATVDATLVSSIAAPGFEHESTPDDGAFRDRSHRDDRDAGSGVRIGDDAAPAVPHAAGSDRRVAPRVTPADMPDAVPQRLAERVTARVARLDAGRHEMQLTLEPPELGTLRVQAVLDRGTLALRLAADHEDAHALLARTLDHLRDGLAQHGFGADRLSIDVALDTSGRHAGGRQAPDALPHAPRPVAAAAAPALPRLAHTGGLASAVDLWV